jgi:DNA-binding NarL/FixJ family response regulator
MPVIIEPPRGSSGRQQAFGSGRPTEHDVVQLVAEGLGNKDIAESLQETARHV